MISDLHVHTQFSVDSNAAMEAYCEEALRLGVEYICFTDHVDYNRNDEGYGYYRPEQFFDQFRRVQDKYSHKLTLLCGIEFAEPHVYPKELERLAKLPYDFILGSIHFWINDIFAGNLMANGIGPEEAFEKYWLEVHKAACFGGFDSLAHLDFPKRYYKKLIWNESVVFDIFKELVKKDIALEINTSTLRSGLGETMPGKDMLALYEKAGGRKITIGADTHRPGDLASGYSEAAKLLTENMVSGYYRQRRFIALKGESVVAGLRAGL